MVAQPASRVDSLVGNNAAGAQSSLDCFGGGSAGQNAPPTGVLPSAGLTHRMLTVRGHNEPVAIVWYWDCIGLDWTRLK